MTETEWLAATDPRPMLAALRAASQARRRKLQLFAAACCRRIWPLLTDERSRAAVEWLEANANRKFSVSDANRIARAAWEAHSACIRQAEEQRWIGGLETPAREIPASLAAHAVSWAIGGARRSVGRQAQAVREVAWMAARAAEGARPGITDWGVGGTPEEALQCQLVRCIWGPRLFQRVHLDPAWLAWNDGTARRLAAAANESRMLPAGTLDGSHLGVLADALEDAGCHEQRILEHLREPGGVHVLGCWVVDLLLAKE